MDTYKTNDNVFSSFSFKNNQGSPVGTSIPEGAWQEEESLEVYRKKRAQRPPVNGNSEIVRFVGRIPRSDEEVYETVHPRRDGRRELILLEPVQFDDEFPETHYDDYSLYRMEEYVDAGDDLCNRDKEPTHYTIQRVDKAGQPSSDIEKPAKEEVIAPVEEMETTSLNLEERETVKKRSSHEKLTIYSPSSPLRERGPYVSTVSVGDVPVERGSDAEGSDKSCSRCCELLFGERTNDTPVLSRTVFYEREVAKNNKPAEREARERRDSRASSRHTFTVDDEIAHVNSKVDSVFRRAYDDFAPRTNPLPIRTLPTVTEEESNDENLDSFKNNSEHLMNEYKETRKQFFKKERTAAPRIHIPSRRYSTGFRPGRMQMYERTIHTPPSRSTSAAPSIRSFDRTPYCSCQMSCRESDKSYIREPSMIQEVPVQKERSSFGSQKSRTNNGKFSHLHCSAPVHETITTERYERIEKVKKAFPATAV